LFYENLLKICKERGTTPTNVTTALGISGGTLGQWKKGSSPTGKIIIRFADYFDVTTDYLLTGKEPSSWSKNERRIEMVQRRIDKELAKEALLRSVGNYITPQKGAIGSHEWDNPVVPDKIITLSKESKVEVERLNSFVDIMRQEKPLEDEFYPDYFEFASIRLVTSTRKDEIVNDFLESLREEKELMKEIKAIHEETYTPVPMAKTGTDN